MEWKDCCSAFHIDGSLRDIYVQKTSIEDWENLLLFLLSLNVELKYDFNGKLAVFPSCVATIFNEKEHTHNLSIDLDGIILNCHFFIECEIEMDIDPKEIRSQKALNTILKFVSDLGKHLGKDVVITEENTRDAIWFKYVFEDDKCHFQSSIW